VLNSHKRRFPARGQSHHSLERIREMKEINTSLSCLKDCIRAQAQQLHAPGGGGGGMKAVAGHIPFRRSKLTLLLRDAFDGAAQGC
jgi:hypothetical protein